MMSRGSPSADRLISILNFFVTYPKQSFSVAEIVKSLQLSRATCNAFMVSLAEAGYLYRGSDRRYMLGPAILDIAHLAQTAFAPIDIALLEMRQLADHLDTIIAVHARDGEFIVTLDRAASARHLSLIQSPYSRHALHPYGVLFLANLDDAEIEATFESASPSLGAEDRAYERSLIAFAREHGFLFAVHRARDNSPKRRCHSNITTGDFVSEVEPGEVYRPIFIMAPIRDRSGRTVFEVAVSGFDCECTGSEVRTMATTIIQACNHVTILLAGQV